MTTTPTTRRERRLAARPWWRLLSRLRARRARRDAALRALSAGVHGHDTDGVAS